MTLIGGLDQVGRVVKQPPFWAAFAGILVLSGGEKGRRAAVRASACYGATAAVANLALKPAIHRRRPRGAGPGPFGPLTSSMPSGHAASDTAFAVAAWREMPSLCWPMVLLTTASHWSLVRARSHYLSDVLVGDALGVAIAVWSLRLWPTPASSQDEPEDDDSVRAGSV
jgi:membrane-associated phospholipid phosphatase